jgi:acyl carrier protein
MTRDDLIEFLRIELGLDITGIDEDTALFSSGLVDSFSLVTLIAYIEHRERFRMSPLDVNLDNMDTVARILGYLERIRLST